MNKQSKNNLREPDSSQATSPRRKHEPQSERRFIPTANYRRARDTTILMFVDLVGSTALSAQNPLQTSFPRVKDFQNAVLTCASKYCGKPVKGIGDEVMLRFDGDPSEACVNAIRTALDVQNKLDKLMRSEYKTGEGNQMEMSCKTVIHLVLDAIRIGYIEKNGRTSLAALIRGRGSRSLEERHSRDLVGHHVNLAARLSKLVRGNEIIISEAAYKLLLELQKPKLKIYAAGPTTIFGFKGTGKGTNVYSLSRNKCAPPQYPTRGIVRVTLEDKHDSAVCSRESLVAEYLQYEEIKGRCSWAAWVTKIGGGVTDHLIFNLGAFDLDEFEDMVLKYFYSKKAEKQIRKTRSIFMRKTDLSHALKYVTHSTLLQPKGEIWLVKLTDLGKKAERSELENWFSKILEKVEDIQLHDFMWTWGEYDACVCVGASEESNIQQLYEKLKASEDLEPYLESPYGITRLPCNWAISR